MNTREEIFRSVFQQGVEARRKDWPRDFCQGKFTNPALTEEWLKGWDAENAALRATSREVPQGELVRGNVLRTGVKRGGGIAPFTRAEPDDFTPSTEDKRVAQESGKPVLLSVFDCKRTTVPQCLEIRELLPGTPVFNLLISEIKKIETPARDGFLRVVEDPLPSPWNALPGADGHCGIQGVDRPSGCPRRDYRAVLSRLIDIAVPAT